MRVTGALLVLWMMGLAAGAQADVAPGPRPTPTPPPIPPDPTCLESAVRGEGETCSRCQTRDGSCIPRMEAAGFEVRCAAGSYVILCAPTDREPPPPDVAKDPAVANDPAKEDPPVAAANPPQDPWPPSTDSGGCTCNATGPPGAALPLALAAIALLAATRRR